MTATGVLTIQDTGIEQVVADRSGPCGETGMFTWCEVENLQDAVCGHGLALMESRDDDNNTSNDTDVQMLDVGGERNFIDERLKTFNEELKLTEYTGNKGSSYIVDSSPTMVSNFDGTKFVSTSSSQKSKFEQFMFLVDTASKTHGTQSIPVADLYVNMGTELCSPRATTHGATDATKSKEFALLLFEEAFTIYQAKLGDSNKQTIDTRVHLGLTYRSLGRFGEALDCFCLAVYMREAILGELHPSVSEIWVLISSVHHAKKKLELALKASAKALTGYRNAHGDKHSTVMGVLKTIAQIHIEMGNNEKAIDIQKYVRIHTKDNRAEI